MGVVFGERENQNTLRKPWNNDRTGEDSTTSLQGYQVGTAHMQVIWKSFVSIFSAGILGSKEEYQ